MSSMRAGKPIELISSAPKPAAELDHVDAAGGVEDAGQVGARRRRRVDQRPTRRDVIGAPYAPNSVPAPSASAHARRRRPGPAKERRGQRWRRGWRARRGRRDCRRTSVRAPVPANRSPSFRRGLSQSVKNTGLKFQHVLQWGTFNPPHWRSRMHAGSAGLVPDLRFRRVRRSRLVDQANPVTVLPSEHDAKLRSREERFDYVPGAEHDCRGAAVRGNAHRADLSRAPRRLRS